MKVDWTIVFAGGAFALALVTTISGFVYLIMRLVTNPLKEDLDDLKNAFVKINEKLKSDTEISNIIEVAIANHERKCPLRKPK